MYRKLPLKCMNRAPKNVSFYSPYSYISNLIWIRLQKGHVYNPRLKKIRKKFFTHLEILLDFQIWNGGNVLLTHEYSQVDAWLNIYESPLWTSSSVCEHLLVAVKIQFSVWRTWLSADRDFVFSPRLKLSADRDCVFSPRLNRCSNPNHWERSKSRNLSNYSTNFGEIYRK